MKTRQVWLVAAMIVGSYAVGSFAGSGKEQKSVEVQDVVRAKRFDIVGADGKTMFSLSALDDGWPGIAIGREGSPMGFASLIAAPDGSVSIKVGPVGGGEGLCLLAGSRSSSLELAGAGGGRATLSIEADGSPHLRLTDKDGKAVFETP